MNNVNIIIPVDDYNEIEKYYRDVLSFPSQDGQLFLPVDSLSVSLKLMIIDEEAKEKFPPKKRFPIFGYQIEKNFLSYCKAIYMRGALIEMACATPGGYYARISDPAGNQFEIECSNFDESDSSVDTTELPFFYSY